jgi:hypothetical protein
MNTLSDLRSTLGEHAEHVPDGEAVARIASVRHRVSVVRRRRRTVGAGLISLALVIGGATALAHHDRGDALPSAPTVLGVKAPVTMTSLGYTYRTDGLGEAFGRTGSVDVAASDQPRLFSWTTDGGSAVRITLPDGDVLHSTETGFRDYVVLSPGVSGTMRVHVDEGRVGLASYRLTDAAPPGYTKDGVTFRTTVAGRSLLTAAISDEGQSELTATYVVPDGPVQDHLYCAGLEKGQTLHLAVDGQTREWVEHDTCDPASAFDPGSGGFGQFRSGRPGAVVTVRFYVTAGAKDERVLPASQVGHLRMGFGIYGPIAESRVGGWRVENELESHGHTWVLARTTSSGGAPITVAAVGRDRLASVVWNSPSGVSSVRWRAGPSSSVQERYQTGQGASPGLWAPAGAPVHVRFDRGTGTLGLALYDRAD